ncbi:organic solute transporter Ostalpha-domain-containing protein [Mucor mucedo]|uniref:organic solute transporter Ostalpha-domain-containing protein n=1 Tax=Mucor mucedo TaxID=29922 RepID=UPI00221FC3A4|nr:organic solute transporter Ostalpha-domain-containing protein [Mucor mucedo]KAI7888134.1 organic solute transporter Ostalpha-domain-containing protein [Mucor mucedo]
MDNYGDGGAGSEFQPILIQLALLCTVVGSCISLFSVWLHWKNYRKPNQQRQVIRILWMVPIYGISTYISLVSLNVAFYVDTFRDIYEAFVIYAFFNLLLNKLGGERALIIMLHSRPPTENFFPGTIYSSEIFVGDPYTFLFVKRGILQFVYVKPVLAILTMILKATGKYHEGDFSASSSYFYLTFFYNLSVCLSLWCLMVFFYATKKDLTAFRPLPKFLCVKAIIFFSFWQSVVVALLVFAGVIPDSEHISVAIQDFLVCIEMVPFAIAHSFSFSYEDYFDQNVHSARMPVRRAIRDSFGLKDVVMDTLDTLNGSGFNYRAFEPSEGVPHMGSSRTSRIMAGLRYSNMTTKKHWLEPAPTSRFLNSSRGMNEESMAEMDSEPLEFEDPDPHDEMEILFAASRKMVFGDYNYPVIDFRVPLWRQARQERRLQRYGGISQTSRYDDRKMNKAVVNGDEESLLGTREGCIDVIIKQGKDNYVVVDDMSDDDEEVSRKTLPTPVRKPTLSNIHRHPSSSASTPTVHHPSSSSSKKMVQPSFSTPSKQPVVHSTPKPRYPQAPQAPQTVRESAPPPISYSNASTTPQHIAASPSEEDAPQWQWPDQFSHTNHSSYTDNDDDLLSGDVWK